MKTYIFDIRLESGTILRLQHRLPGACFVIPLIYSHFPGAEFIAFYRVEEEKNV